MAPPPPTVPASSHGVHMTGGEGDDSYAKKSTSQRRVQQRLAPLVEAAVADLLRRGAAAAAPPQSIGIADLGCSSGLNTLFLVSTVVDAVRRRCAAAGAPCPELCVFLNDLPGNDFNAVFRQWLGGGLPQGTVGQGPSRTHGCAMYDHPNNILNDMASRGLVDKARLDAYNIPAYEPCAEGSFETVGMESYETAAATPACDAAGLARAVRAVHEPMLARHFGGGIDMDEFVRTAEAYRLIGGGGYRGALVHVMSAMSLRRKCKC